MKMTWRGWQINKNCHVLVKQVHGNFLPKTLSCKKIKLVLRDVKWCFYASWGLKGLNINTWSSLNQSVSFRLTWVWGELVEPGLGNYLEQLSRQPEEGRIRQSQGKMPIFSTLRIHFFKLFYFLIGNCPVDVLERVLNVYSLTNIFRYQCLMSYSCSQRLR